MVAGVDEAGRGAWAGPVVAAAVVLPVLDKTYGINDSKQLTPDAREKLFKKIHALTKNVGVGIASVGEVNRLGVAQASFVAMQRAVDSLSIHPEHILVDGYKVNFIQAPSSGVIDGDAKSLSIAAASIIAKVTRDKLMTEAHKKYPPFGFAIHKGYGTSLHRERIERHGTCSLHRKNFAPIRQVLARSKVQIGIND